MPLFGIPFFVATERWRLKPCLWAHTAALRRTARIPRYVRLVIVEVSRGLLVLVSDFLSHLIACCDDHLIRNVRCILRRAVWR